MSIRIDLDDAQAVRTNYDIISGRIQIWLRRKVKISRILVKLEGESRSALKADIFGRDGQGRIGTERHRILYRIQRVLPEGADNSWNGMTWTTLPAGKHEYAFRFQIPLENDCADLWRVSSETRDRGIRIDSIGRNILFQHPRQVLPPSLTGILGVAEIKYSIKVTIRPWSFLKENWRSSVGFKFTPIHLAMPSHCGESCTKIPYSFKSQSVPIIASRKERKERLKNTRKKPTYGLNAPPKGELEARLPRPSILMCNEPIPLRLIIRKLNTSSESPFIVSCTVHVLVQTKVRVNQVVKIINSTWVLANLNGLSIQINSSNEREGSEYVIDNFLWNNLLLPSKFTPSFQTCNLSRKYELDVCVGIGYGKGGEFQPQIIYLPLRLPIEIWSSNLSTLDNANAHDTTPFQSMDDLLPSYEYAIGQQCQLTGNRGE